MVHCYPRNNFRVLSAGRSQNKGADSVALMSESQSQTQRSGQQQIQSNRGSVQDGVETATASHHQVDEACKLLVQATHVHVMNIILYVAIIYDAKIHFVCKQSK